MKTNLGEIVVTINEEEFNYTPIFLRTESKIFNVDGRYKIEVELERSLNKPCIIECTLVSENKVKGGIDSGQDLVMLSFDSEDNRLSIGTREEIPSTDYCYLDNGIRIIAENDCNADKIVFGVAWMSMHNRDVYSVETGLAADPSYFHIP